MVQSFAEQISLPRIPVDQQLRISFLFMIHVQETEIIHVLTKKIPSLSSFPGKKLTKRGWHITNQSIDLASLVPKSAAALAAREKTSDTQSAPLAK